ncbi:MAG: PQQ-binding-like beta-propeller repeat protein [Pirellulaceae bacterium]|nr:PQQ-binding-like beta-propeller repeat protein [Pirellulaceae bacterium]
MSFRFRTSLRCCLGLASWCFAAACFGQAINPANPTPGGQISNIFPAAPRELRQNLTRAQAALDEERYSDAVAELGQIINSPTSDDYFLGTPGQGDAQVSLKTQALEILGSMPAKGRQMYELQFGAEAKAGLDAALDSGDLQQVTDVARRYFHTRAGYEATLLLGRYQLDQGRPLAAALVLKRIADSPSAAALYDPELSVLLATCWVHARMPQKATDVLVSLKKRQPAAKIRLLDGDRPLFDADDKALAWLEEIVGGGRTPLTLAATQWVMFRGNESRTATSVGGLPLVNFRWYSPTINDPADAGRVKALARVLRDRNEAALCSLQPLVVQDSVIFRHPDSSKLIGASLKTGKVQWVFPPFDENPAAQASRNNAPKTATANLREQELRQRVWEDHAFGQISSDGRQAYVIDELGYASMAGNVGVPRVVIGPGGRPVLNNSWSKPSNMLVALDLKKQGYQVWAVGGNTGDNPALSGAFFLGPPLPLGDQLYALAELNSEIRLVCLGAGSGDLEWKQQLAMISEDAHQIVFDRVRRLAGASPSYADGVLVCPTSAGAIVAVDLATRSLRWGYQYERWDAGQRTINGFTSSRTVTPNQGSWVDGTATIADGAVIVTPVESQYLHCLDLLTGKVRWPAQARDDMLYVACVHQGNIILVGKSAVKAIKLSDGTPAWSGPTNLSGETPTGRGFASDKFYFLPVTGQKLLKIDLADGKIVATAKTEIDLGNVVCYQDQLVSQSPQQMAAFYLSEPLVQRIELVLKENPNDAEALALKGQILLQEGKKAESLDLLRRAVSKNPENTSAKSLLVKVMLSLLRDDFAANFALAEELDQLVTDPAQQREILRFRALGLAKAGKTGEALAALVALADRQDSGGSAAGSGADALETTERDLGVRRDRWLQGQISALYRTADEPTREQLAALVQTRLDRTVATGGPGGLREFINLYGFHPLADRARLALADKLIASDQLLEAELLLGDLLESSDKVLAGGSRAALAVLYEKAKRLDLAARYYGQLKIGYGDVVCRDGLTGAQLTAKSAASAPLQALLAGSLWPAGRVDVAPGDSETQGRIVSAQRLMYGIQMTQFQGAALRGLRAAFDPNQYQIVVRDDLGRQLGAGNLKNSDGSYRRYFSIPYNLLSAKANGHLVVVSLGGEVVAIDALRADRAGNDALAWRLDAIDLDPASQRSMYPQQRQTTNPLVGSRLITYDPTGRLNFYTGPVQSIGVAFQKGGQLVCVDPVNGQTLWERSKIPAGAEVFGDHELLFVADPNTDDALVLSAVDGALVGRRKIEKADRRWASSGRNVLAWEQTGSIVKVRLYDAWAQKDLWTKQVPLGSRGTLVDGEEVAILEPSGQFSVVSLASGQTRFAVPLEAERSLSWIGVQRSQEQYTLIASQETTESPPGMTIQPITTAGSQQTRVHGRVYAFDRRTGKMRWQVPAFVAWHFLPQDQPTETPLLFFIRNSNKQGGSNKWITSVLCLDKRDGRIVWENEGAAAQTNHCELIADPLKKTVTLNLWSQTSKSVVFQLTSHPMPPQPPAQTGALASDMVGQPVGLVDRSIDAAFDLLSRGLNPGQPVPPGAPPR